MAALASPGRRPQRLLEWSRTRPRRRCLKRTGRRPIRSSAWPAITWSRPRRSWWRWRATIGPIPSPRLFVTGLEELLSTTRLLLDAGVDQPALHDLLEDLELVLAQVARMPRTRPAADSRFVTEALDQRDVLPRLTLLLADTRGITR